MASLYNRDGWLHISYYSDGEHYRQSLKLKANKEGWKDARQFKKEIEYKIATEHFFYKNKKPMLKLSKALLLFYDDKNIPYDNKGSYHSVVKKLIEFKGDRNLKNIKQIDMIKFIEHLKTKTDLKHNTISTLIAHLRILFNHFIHNDFYFNRNPVPNVKSMPSQIKIIPDEHLQLIINGIRNTDFYYIIMMLRLTGLRISELLALKKSDIDLKNKILFIHNFKAKTTNHFPIYPKLYEFLYNFIDEFVPQITEKLFHHNRIEVLRKFKQTCNMLQLPNYNLHMLRKSFLSDAATKMNPNELRILARHSDIKTTLKHYVNIDIQNIGAKL